MYKRKRNGSFNVPRKRARAGTYTRRPSAVRYTNLVTSQPRRAPLASRGYSFPIREKKTIDGTGTIQVNTTGSFTLLNGCIQGTDYTQRIGRKLVNNSLYIRGYTVTEATNASSPVVVSVGAQMVRMIIFADMQPNGMVPVVGDLLNQATPQSQLNLTNRDRFKIYCDKQWCFDPFMLSATAGASYASGSRQIYPIKKYKKLNMETVFNSGNAGTIGDIASGALYMFWIGNLGAGSGIDANAVVSTRVRFLDP